MNHALTPQQMQGIKIEHRRIEYCQLTGADEELRRLEESIPTLPIAEFNQRKAAIEERRRTIRELIDKAS